MYISEKNLYAETPDEVLNNFIDKEKMKKEKRKKKKNNKDIIINFYCYL